MTSRIAEHPAAASPDAAACSLPWLETSIESVVGNRLGAGVYRRWVESLHLAGDARVLDVGTGAGACARHLAAALPSGTLTCLEVDPRWLAIARRRLSGYGSRVEFVLGDATAWSRPGAFEAAVAHFVLHDLPHRQRAQALSRIAESLTSRGTLYLREPIGHGMTADELESQLFEAEFEPWARHEPSRVPLMGPVVSAAWTRSRRAETDG